MDNDTNDFVSGGLGTGDICVVDLKGGATDDFDSTCETVLRTTAAPVP